MPIPNLASTYWIFVALTVLLRQPLSSLATAIPKLQPRLAALSNTDASNVTNSIEYSGPPDSSVENLGAGVPAPFQIDLRYIPGGLSFPDTGFYASAIWAMAKVAQEPFEQEQTESMVVSEVGFIWTFERAVFSEVLKIKEILWSIFGVFENFAARSHWQEATWVSKWHDNAVGVGQLVIDEAVGSRVNISSNSLASKAEVGITPIGPAVGVTLSSFRVGNSTKDKLSIELLFLETLPQRFHPQSVYREALILVLESAPNEKDRPAKILTSQDAEFTLALVATDATDLKWWMATAALCLFLDKLRDQETEAKWKPAVASVKLGDEKIVGHALLYPGRVLGDNEVKATVAKALAEGGNNASETAAVRITAS